MERDQEFDINVYTIIIIGILAFMIFITGCEQQKENNDQTGFDSTTMASKRTTDTYQSNGRGVDDSVIYEFVREYPEMHISYIPSDEGSIETVKGNYMVAIDHIDSAADLNKFVKYIEQRYKDRARELNDYNKNVNVPAQPKEGFDAFYRSLDKQLASADIPVEGTLFVQFVVSKDGEVRDIDVVDNTYYLLPRANVDKVEKVVEDAIKATDADWTPAKDGNEPVDMKVEIPVFLK